MLLFIECKYIWSLSLNPRLLNRGGWPACAGGRKCVWNIGGVISDFCIKKLEINFLIQLNFELKFFVSKQWVVGLKCILKLYLFVNYMH
jgi:hypothetical protein